jgi:drug/metabolite transporter (DMT)-like permease
MAKAFILGIAASFFFSLTFILNERMNISGGSWLWSSSLRYIFMLPILFVIIVIKNELNDVLKDIMKRPMPWFIWSTIGFGLFYAPLTYASVYGASWLVSGTWQITIICGALLSPLFFKNVETENGTVKVRNKIPRKALLISSIILIGIFLMQLEKSKDVSYSEVLIGIIPVVIAAFSYPLGNRKMIEVCDNKFTTLQRVFGMTLCSMPFWIIISAFALMTAGLPSGGQVIQSFIVAVSSGVIATILFFKATDIVGDSTRKLAIIESTQSGEVIFTLLGGVLVFHNKIPTFVSMIGIELVVIGIILNSLIETKK